MLKSEEPSTEAPPPYQSGTLSEAPPAYQSLTAKAPLYEQTAATAPPYNPYASACKQQWGGAQRAAICLFSWLLIANVVGMIIVASMTALVPLTIYMSVILGLINGLFIAASIFLPNYETFMICSGVDIFFITLWIILSATMTEYPVLGIVFHVLGLVPSLMVLGYVIYSKRNQGNAELFVHKQYQLFFPWSYSKIPLLTGCLGVFFCLLCQIVVVTTSTVVKKDPFYAVSISSYLDELYGASVPLFLMVVIVLGIGTFYRHPIYFESKLAWGNVFAIITNGTALLGLFGLTIFSNEDSEKSPNGNLEVHLLFTNICFICFSLYELVHTLGLAMNVLNKRVDFSIAALLTLAAQIVCNIGTFGFYAAWKASGMRTNLFEWISVTFIWFYFITIGFMCIFVSSNKELNRSYANV